MKLSTLISIKTAALLLATSSSFGQITSNATGSWNTAGTWSPAGVPNGADNIVIDGAIVLNKNLTTSNGISGTLIVNSGRSLVHSGTKDVSIKNGGTLVVNGVLEVYNLDFSAGSHIYIALDGQIIVRNNFTNNNNSNDVIIDGVLTIYGNAYNGNGAVISGAGNINTVGGAFTGSGVISSTVSLPVTLISFTAKQEDNHVRIEWITASEFDNDHFTLERSLDGINFTAIGNIKGAGNSMVLNEYHFSDEVFYETTYYKLKQTDFNGASSYYGGIISVISKEYISEAVAYPNPIVNTDLHIDVDSAIDAGKTIVILTDAAGNEIYQYITAEVSMRLTIPHYILQPGIYVLIIRSGKTEISKKLVVK